MLTTTIEIDPLEILRFTDIKQKNICRDRKTLKSWMDLPPEKNPFPKPIHFSVRSIGWRRIEVEQWIQRNQQKTA